MEDIQKVETEPEVNVVEPEKTLREQLETMGLSELKEKLKYEYGKTEVPFAKKPSTPSKSDIASFIITLDSLKKELDSDIEVINVPSIDDIIKPVPAREFAKLTREQRVDLKDKLIRVKIRKNPLAQSLDSSTGHVEFLPWVDSRGQRRLATVAYNVPWHVPRQVLISLYQAKSSEFIQEGNSVREVRDRNPLYDIEILPQLDKAQMKNIENVQRSRRK